ncbi:MAG: hypothetical protein M0P71_01800 [Melioribacteraceae bacterium]|nr:hypothetical protein [Melioribacteraceae bacterium]
MSIKLESGEIFSLHDDDGEKRTPCGWVLPKHSCNTDSDCTKCPLINNVILMTREEAVHYIAKQGVKMRVCPDCGGIKNNHEAKCADCTKLDSVQIRLVTLQKSQSLRKKSNTNSFLRNVKGFSPPVAKEIQNLWRRGNAIQAIKIYRTFTKEDLKTAKDTLTEFFGK